MTLVDKMTTKRELLQSLLETGLEREVVRKLDKLDVQTAAELINVTDEELANIFDSPQHIRDLRNAVRKLRRHGKSTAAIRHDTWLSRMPRAPFEVDFDTGNVIFAVDSNLPDGQQLYSDFAQLRQDIKIFADDSADLEGWNVFVLLKLFQLQGARHEEQLRLQTESQLDNITQSRAAELRLRKFQNFVQALQNTPFASKSKKYPYYSTLQQFIESQTQQIKAIHEIGARWLRLQRQVFFYHHCCGLPMAIEGRQQHVWSSQLVLTDKKRSKKSGALSVALNEGQGNVLSAAVAYENRLRLGKELVTLVPAPALPASSQWQYTANKLPMLWMTRFYRSVMMQHWNPVAPDSHLVDQQLWISPILTLNDYRNKFTFMQYVPDLLQSFVNLDSYQWNWGSQHNTIVKDQVKTPITKLKLENVDMVQFYKLSEQAIKFWQLDNDCKSSVSNVGSAEISLSDFMRYTRIAEKIHNLQVQTARKGVTDKSESKLNDLKDELPPNFENERFYFEFDPITTTFKRLQTSGDLLAQYLQNAGGDDEMHKHQTNFNYPVKFEPIELPSQCALHSVTEVETEAQEESGAGGVAARNVSHKFRWNVDQKIKKHQLVTYLRSNGDLLEVTVDSVTKDNGTAIYAIREAVADSEYQKAGVERENLGVTQIQDLRQGMLVEYLSWSNQENAEYNGWLPARVGKVHKKEGTVDLWQQERSYHYETAPIKIRAPLYLTAEQLEMQHEWLDKHAPNSGIDRIRFDIDQAQSDAQYAADEFVEIDADTGEEDYNDEAERQAIKKTKTAKKRKREQEKQVKRRTKEYVRAYMRSLPGSETLEKRYRVLVKIDAGPDVKLATSFLSALGVREGDMSGSQIMLTDDGVTDSSVLHFEIQSFKPLTENNLKKLMATDQQPPSATWVRSSRKTMTYEELLQSNAKTLQELRLLDSPDTLKSYPA